MSGLFFACHVTVTPLKHNGLSQKDLALFLSAGLAPLFDLGNQASRILQARICGLFLLSILGLPLPRLLVHRASLPLTDGEHQDDNPFILDAIHQPASNSAQFDLSNPSYREAHRLALSGSFDALQAFARAEDEQRRRAFGVPSVPSDPTQRRTQRPFAMSVSASPMRSSSATRTGFSLASIRALAT